MYVYLLLIMWCPIDIILFIMLLFTKKVKKYEDVMSRHSIESVKSLGTKFMDELSRIMILIPVGLIIYIVIYNVPDKGIQTFLDWYRGIFIVVLFPLFFTWIRDKNISFKSIWNKCLIALAIIFSVVGYYKDTEEVKDVLEYRIILNLLITVLLIAFIIAMIEIGKESKKYYSKKISQKDIRKDLYYRTPGLVVNISNIELIKCCEKHFDEYMHRYKKIKELHAIEYVKLTGVYRKSWYKKTACFMKKFVILSLLVILISMFFRKSYMQLTVIGLIIAFWILINIYKHKDLECLYIIGIRCFYDEWGYYLTCTNKNKFVGNSQMIENTKFHKYIHSFLDIVALCRAVAFSDKINGEERICIVTSNLCELFCDYSDYRNNQNWVMAIPLWAGALFEFYVTGKISNDVKNILMKFVDEGSKTDISIFLQSFWADIERKELKDGISKYIQLFEKTLYN